MTKLDEMSVVGFLKISAKKLDGISCLIVLLILIGISMLGLISGVMIGRYAGISLAFAAAGLLPVVIIFYISLVYFSSAGKISEILNSILLFAVPVLFIYYS